MLGPCKKNRTAVRVYELELPSFGSAPRCARRRASPRCRARRAIGFEFSTDQPVLGADSTYVRRRGCREASSVSQLGAVRDLGCSGLASFCSSHTQEKLDSASLPYIKRACKAVRPGAWYRSSYKNAPLPNPPSVANLPSRCDSRSHQNDARDAAAALFSRKVAVPIGTKVHATP